MDTDSYKSQGHPLASFEDETEDVCYLLQDWAEKNGHGTWENGGEFDPDDDAFLYLLYEDTGTKELRLRLNGELRGDTLEIESITVEKTED